MGQRFRMPGELPVPPREGEAAATDSPLTVQLVLSRATELARGGHYEEATSLLSALRVSARQAAPVFHLAALIRAQLGQFEEAATIWSRVLEIEPSHAGASAGLREIQRQRSRPLWMSVLLTWPVAGALLLGALFLVLSRPSSPPDGLERLAQEQTKLGAEVQRLRAALEGASTHPAAPEFDPGDLPLIVETRGDERFVRFKAPLFDTGCDTLRPDARLLLERIAEKLSGNVRTVVVGYAVEPVAEAADQARRRAAAVAALLRAESLDRPGSEAPAPAEAVALRLCPVQR